MCVFYDMLNNSFCSVLGLQFFCQFKKKSDFCTRFSKIESMCK